MFLMNVEDLMRGASVCNLHQGLTWRGFHPQVSVKDHMTFDTNDMMNDIHLLLVIHSLTDASVQQTSGQD